MACKTTFELHHNFPKLAEESGFTFNTHKPRVHIEWRKIKLIDIENVIRDRKFVVVEKHINDILDCSLESEFDVRILDEGVLKIFRLAQLAVEYQQFCRHYLDRSVIVLRQEVTNLLQELDSTKQNLREKEEENRKLRRKSKNVRTPLPYGNENIATMILKTLNQNKGDIYNSNNQLDNIQYNRCSYCEKVFMNQLYLKSHISRRHGHVLDIPQKDTTDTNPTVDNMNDKLNNEVSELKLKLQQMEDLMENIRKHNNPTQEEGTTAEISNLNINDVIITKTNDKEMKDAGVLTNEEGFILEKIEEWKKEEHNKHNEEIKLLRQQITDIINNKEKEDQTIIQKELKIMEELHATIKQQGDEILSLKNKLQNEESNEVEKRKEIEAKMSYWVKSAEIQSNEYKSLLQKLNEVTKEAKECRDQVQIEKEKAEHLQRLLEKQQNNRSPKRRHLKYNDVPATEEPEEIEVRREPEIIKNKLTPNIQRRPTADIITLKKLQQKAQELLDIDQTSTSDNSNTSDLKLKPKQSKGENKVSHKKKHKYDNKRKETIIPNSKKNSICYEKNDVVKRKDTSEKKLKPTLKSIIEQLKNPIKVVRAKITEEVNNRLISLGVDPLKNRISQNVFRKQRKILQEQQHIKTKKIPSREKIMNSIMTHLDRNTTSTNYEQRFQDYSPNKSKTFSLSSVLSNVKTKALSLVKSNENSNKFSKSHNNVAKTAIALLKTPPESNNSSPVVQKRSTLSLLDKSVREIPAKKGINREMSKTLHKNTNKMSKEKDEESSTDSDTDSEESDKSDEHIQNLDSTSKIISNLIKSPVRKPNGNDSNINSNNSTYKIEVISSPKTEESKNNKNYFMDNSKNSSDDVDSIIDSSPKKNTSTENITSPKHTKGVLKNASSISSLNKKKVLFDMDAIQMKSVSASPSQSITDKSNKNEQYELGITNLDTEEWDISSIDNVPLNTTAKIQISSRTSPKIAELKQTIESQLTRRNPKLSTTVVGGVDVLSTPIQKASFGGSNTSLGSSILDDDSVPIPKQNAFMNTKKVSDKDDSEIEISDLIAGTIIDKDNKK